MNLKEAEAIVQKCEFGIDFNCLDCPVGERLILEVSETGIELTGSICSFVQMLQDLLEEQTG